MDEFLKPSWWISVVVAGLLVNLASAYLKPRVDGALLRSSSWWRSRSAARVAERKRRVNELRQSTRTMAFAYFRAIVRQSQAIYSMQLATVVLAATVTLVALREGLFGEAFVPPPETKWFVGVGCIISIVVYLISFSEHRASLGQLALISEAETDLPPTFDFLPAD